MTDEQFRDMDDYLRSVGWSYDPQSEEFVGSNGQRVDWPDILAAMPDLSLNELDAYTEMARDRRLSDRPV